MIIAGHHIYETCEVCHSLVRLNKPFFGSLHFCLTEEELRRKKIKEQLRPQETMEEYERRTGIKISELLNVKVVT